LQQKIPSCDTQSNVNIEQFFWKYKSFLFQENLPLLHNTKKGREKEAEKGWWRNEKISGLRKKRLSSEEKGNSNLTNY
jgi:hypothetical protein